MVRKLFAVLLLLSEKFGELINLFWLFFLFLSSINLTGLSFSLLSVILAVERSNLNIFLAAELWLFWLFLIIFFLFYLLKAFFVDWFYCLLFVYQIYLFVNLYSILPIQFYFYVIFFSFCSSFFLIFSWFFLFKLSFFY